MWDFKKYTGRQIRLLLQNDMRIKELKKLRYVHRTQLYKVWKDRYDSIVIKSARILFTKIEYIRNNPIKKGYVNQAIDWKHSSANFYINNYCTGVILRNAGEIV